MPLNYIFWGIYIFCLLFGVWGYYEPAQPTWYRRAGGYLAIWILVGMLGWRVFGAAVK
jgi:hypothetical protein